MTGLEKLAAETAVGTASEIVKKSEGLLKSLFGKAFEEKGAMIADNIRFRRMKNQIKILEKTAEFLQEKDIEPRKVDLKVLAPLLDYSSLEEDESLQIKWAKLIKNVLMKPISISIQQNAMEVLNKISNDEAILLDKIYISFINKRKKKAQQKNDMWKNNTQHHITPESLPVDLFAFDIKGMAAELKISPEIFETQISNLVTLGTLKYHALINVHTARKSDTNPEDDNLDLDLDIEDYKKVRLTKFGLTFVELCKK